MKKKLLSLLLIMAMAVVMLAGCSKGGDKETQAAGTTAGGETTKGADEQTTAGAGTEAQTVTMWTWNRRADEDGHQGRNGGSGNLQTHRRAYGMDQSGRFHNRVSDADDFWREHA